MKKLLAVLVVASLASLGFSAMTVRVLSGGTEIAYPDHRPPQAWNFAGGPRQVFDDVTSHSLVIGTQWAPYDPDGGITQGSPQEGYYAPSPSPSATCAPHGLMALRRPPDGGIDTAYQCCQIASGAFQWVAGYCH